MKKIHFGSTVRKAAKTGICALLVAAMVVPASISQIPTAAPEAEAVAAETDADLPEPIATVTMDQGFMGEKAANGMEATKSEDVLQFEEKKDADGNYMFDDQGEYIYELTDEPFIEGGVYKYGVDGNQPTTYFDEKFGHVLMLDGSKTHKRFIKTVSDELDDKHPVYTGGFDEKGEPTETPDPNSILQKEVTTHSAVTINNPFAGKDFSEEPTYDEEEGLTWTKGISISYWVKAGKNELTETQVGENILKNDSILFTFQNNAEEGDYTYNVDDLMKYEACLGYDATLNGDSFVGPYTGDTYTKDMYALGERKTVTDPATQKTYTVAYDYGMLVRFNKDFEGKTGVSETEKIYFMDEKKTSGEKINFKDKDGNTVRLFDLEYQLYDNFHTLDYEDSNNKIKRGRINGSLSIAASNSFAFKEDDYTEKVVGELNGQPIRQVDKGPKQENPNADDYNEIVQFRHYNTAYWQGDGTVLEEVDVTDEQGNATTDTQWHYVTCVIMNDWVDFYVDGELMSCDDWMYAPSNGLYFNDMNASKYFNKGCGLRYPYNKMADNVSAWSADGTARNSPANKLARTMLDWISDPDTVLMIGGQGTASEGLTAQNIGNGDGTLLDDITFYDVPLDEDQAVALYNKAVADKEAVDEPVLLKKFDFENDQVGSMPAGMSAAETNGSDVEAPVVVNEENRGHILKISASKVDQTAGTVFDNPFKGMTDLEGATISYWYKGAANKAGTVQPSIGASFRDEPKVLVHGKIQDAVKDVASRTGLYLKSNLEGYFEGGYDTKVYESLKNKYYTSVRRGGNYVPGKPGFQQEDQDALEEFTNRANSFTEWHHVAMVVTNAGITVYYDGEELPNRVLDNQKLPAFYGPRFYDGYYQRVCDGFASYKLSSNNQGATPLMTFLTQDDTSAYIGVAHSIGQAKKYEKTYLGGYDNICYYAGAMTAEQVKALYTEEAAATTGPVAGEDTFSFGNSDGGSTVTPPTEDDSGNLVFKSEETGVTVTAPKDSISKDAKLVVSVLSESDAKDKYASADEVLKGIQGLSIGKRVLYDIHFELDGKVVQPTAEVTVSVKAPTGYTAARTSVIYVDGKQPMTVAVVDGNLAYKTSALGQFAFVQAKDGEAVIGNVGPQTSVNGTANKSNTSGTAKASKTGDAANVVIPMLLLAVAFAAMFLARKKRVTE